MRKCISADYIINENLPVASLFKPAKRDIQKMTEYFGKGSNPKTLANTVKDTDKAVSRLYIAVATGWKDCADEFYRRCCELGVGKDYLAEILKKAMQDKSIYLGGSPFTTKYKPPKPDKRTIVDTKVDKPAGTTPKPQKSVSNTRKVIDAETGFVSASDGLTPFS